MPDTNLRELAYRHQHGIHVRLFWDPASGGVSLEVANDADASVFHLPVLSSRALEAFYHPYAYAAA